MAEDKKKLTIKLRFFALAKVAKMVVKTSPIFVVLKIIDSILSAILPLATTFFAASTTTALAEAYGGDPLAGQRAILFMSVTAFLGVIMLIWGNVQGYLLDISRYRLNTSIEDKMYEQFLNLEFWRYDDKKTADLFDKARHFSYAFGMTFNNLAQIFTQVFTLTISLIALAFVSWWLFGLLLIAVIPGLIIQITISRMQIKHWKDNVGTRRSVARIESSLENLNSIAELKLYGVVRHLLNLRLKFREKDERFRIDYDRKYMGRKLLSEAFEAAVELFALIFTTLKIIAHAQPVGQFLYVQQIVSRALSGARSFIMQLNQIDEDISNIFDYQEFMDLPNYQKRKVKITEQPDYISLDNVTFHYPNHDVEVLKNISLKICKHQHVAIVGENGAGKSTLIKLILGLYDPTDGKIFLDNNDLSQVDLSTWHSYLGVLQQEFIKYSFTTVRENIYFGDVSKKLDKTRLEQALDNAEARKFVEKLPRGLDTYVDRWMEDEDGLSGTDFSGGQWQRLALARNFYRNSPIIILDEPTSAIDALAESRIFKKLFADKERTVITISHRLTTVEKADVIFMLEDGEIVEHGTHEYLVSKKGKYYTMFESQLHNKSPKK